MDSIVVPGSVDSLCAIREFAMKAADQAGLGRDAAYKLALAIDEIATNIAVHGYQENNRSGDIRVTAEITEAELIITLEDSAVAYNPKDHVMPTQDYLDNKPLDERQIGGLGVFLVMENVDRFDYEYVDNKNRNIFAMKRGRKAS